MIGIPACNLASGSLRQSPDGKNDVFMMAQKGKVAILLGVGVRRSCLFGLGPERNEKPRRIAPAGLLLRFGLQLSVANLDIRFLRGVFLTPPI